MSVSPMEFEMMRRSITANIAFDWSNEENLTEDTTHIYYSEAKNHS